MPSQPRLIIDGRKQAEIWPGVLTGVLTPASVIYMRTATSKQAQHDFRGESCPAPSCQNAEGWQCAECGHYLPRNQIKDIGGEYYCRESRGHNA